MHEWTEAELEGKQRLAKVMASRGIASRRAAEQMITEGKVIPDNSLVMGAPGKVVRELTPDQARAMGTGARHYVENWKRFKRDLSPA